MLFLLTRLISAQPDILHLAAKHYNLSTGSMGHVILYFMFCISKKSPPDINNKNNPCNNADDIRSPIRRLPGRAVVLHLSHLFIADRACFSINREVSLAVRAFFC